MCYGNLYKRFIIRGGRFLGNEEFEASSKSSPKGKDFGVLNDER